MCSLINPDELFSYKRLDLIVKYLYAIDILTAHKNDYLTNSSKDLYIRHILMRTMGNEPLTKYGNDAKTNIDDYLEQFKKLIHNIKSNGFNPEHRVPISKEGLLKNGAHRIAACMALQEPIAVEYVENGISWDFQWFEENGFTNEDKMRILKGFVDINLKNSAIFIVWNPLFKYLDNIKSLIGKHFDIVGDVKLDFENNYVAFTNALVDIYETNCLRANKYEAILKKAELLQASYLSFKVIVVTNQEKNSDKEIHSVVPELKKEIREFLDHIMPKEIFATVHSSDSERECLHLAKTLLSPNNIKHLKMRLTYNYTPEFIARCNRCKDVLKEIGIKNKDDICVIGSGVMTALGIQPMSDIDFVIKHEYRDRFGDDIVYLGDVDIGKSDRIANRPKNICDDLLIDLDDYHFYFQGLKFANLEIIKDRKSCTTRKKDKEHVRQIDLFEKMIGNINQQKLLMERVNSEKNRRGMLSPSKTREKFTFFSRY